MSDWDDNDGLDPCERPGFHDAMADRADRDLKEMKLEGTYTAWVAAGRPGMAEWNRRQLEDEASALGLDRVATDVARESGTKQGDSLWNLRTLAECVLDAPQDTGVNVGLARDLARAALAADDLLRRLSEWDVMEVSAQGHGDGRYWQAEIAKARLRG